MYPINEPMAVPNIILAYIPFIPNLKIKQNKYANTNCSSNALLLIAQHLSFLNLRYK